MQIVRDLAGYSWGRSDLVRRAMSKKHQDEIDAERKVFIHGDEKLNIPGCIKNGISEAAANKIYDKMVSFAKYAFNKSHAAAYSVTSYYCAWCKEYYPEEYFCAVMRWAEDIEEIASIIADAKDFNVEVLPPDINYSEKDFTINNNKIIFGLSNIKNVGESADEIMRVRSKALFTDIKDFIMRCHVNSGALKSLIWAGAFDSLGYTREQLDINFPYMSELITLSANIAAKEKFIESARKVQAFVDEYQDVEELKERIKAEKISGFQITSKSVPSKESIERRISTAKERIIEFLEDCEDIEIEDCEVNEHESLQQEKEVLGLYLTGHPIDSYLVFTDKIDDAIPDETTEISGIIQSIKIRKDKRGRDWAVFELSDNTATMNCIAFADNYEIIKDLCKDGNAVSIKGNIGIDDFRSTDDDIILQCVVREIEPLRKRSKTFRYVTKSIATWAESDYSKIQKYKDEAGAPLQILDSTTGLVYKASFTVNEDILSIGAKKIAI